MCNTKNTETIRQQLWCDIVTSSIGELTFDKILAEADKVVAEFDERFNAKLLPKIVAESLEKSRVKTKIDGNYKTKQEDLKRLFGDNIIFDVSTNEVCVYTGKSIKNEKVMIYFDETSLFGDMCLDTYLQ